MLTFDHVVAAVDFSPATDPLLQCLDELRALGMQRVTLMHVLEVRYDRRPPIEHREMYEDLLAEQAERLRGKGFEVHPHLETGQPARAIVRYAEQEDADLILLASRGHNLLQRLLLGSTATEVLRTATVPVLLDRIEPADAKDEARCAVVCSQKFSRPLLATDFSALARGAEQAALALTEQAASAVFMAVRDARKSALSAEDARARLDALAEQVTCPVTVRVERGDKASTAIAQVADEEESTALLVGKHGRGYLEEQLTGSTAQNLVKEARRSVLMVPAVSVRQEAPDANVAPRSIA
ncbi:MAG: universal stress protein [Bacteroidetes bacterium]|jgi:nucleotide-binding universal stress UspA family protein|nr:universal stress protein [Bacteroidota bacterium]